MKSDNKNPKENFNETVPCGFIKYSCDKQPRITYMNEKMKELLKFPEPKAGEVDLMELYMGNIFLMIPIEDRRRFALYLDRVSAADAPIAGEMTLLRCDGSKVYVFGWVTKCINEQGQEEYQSVCMDITERHHIKKEQDEQKYLKALKDVYDKIFEYDLDAGTVRCLHSNNNSRFRWVENISMKMEDATEKWITETVVDEDLNRVRVFFKNYYNRELFTNDEKPPQISYRAKASSGDIKKYIGTFLKMDECSSLYCLRCIQDRTESSALRAENDSLKEGIQELVQKFKDGLAAFEVKGNMVTPLYASDNVAEFFGIKKEEWLRLMNQATPIENFVSRSETTYEEFMELLRNGEAEFNYFDIASSKERRIKAICSGKNSKGDKPRYVMLYDLEDQGGELKKGISPMVYIRTFGYFDVFIGDKPIAFRSQKSKELFALLVDRRGGFVSSEEAIGFLWEDETVNPVTLARYRKVALRLKNILEEYGISPVVEAVDGKRRIATELVKCDLYDYLTGDVEYEKTFKGSYLTNYSWGENTLGQLIGETIY